jgi:hypothetical protein
MCIVLKKKLLKIFIWLNKSISNCHSSTIEPYITESTTPDPATIEPYITEPSITESTTPDPSTIEPYITESTTPDPFMEEVEHGALSSFIPSLP